MTVTARTRGPRSLDDEVVASVVEVLAEGRLFRYDGPSASASTTALFEREFAEWLGVRYAVAVNSCSSGLFLALQACGVEPGDEVLVPAFTFIAVPSVVVHARARPVLVEVTDGYAVDPDDLERKITPRTKALLLSYMRGYVPDLDRVTEICDRHGVTLIEDVAHGLGVEWAGVPLGRLGRVSAFSFQSYKLLDGGEGGLVATDDREVALRTILMAGCYDRNWEKHFVSDEDRAWLEGAVNTLPAYGLRMSNLTAAALRPQVPCIERRLQDHETRFARVADGLSGLPLRIPGHPSKARPVRDSLQFELPTLSVAQRRRFVELCTARGLPLQIFGLDPTNARSFWRWSFFSWEDCPRTRALLEQTADMPLPLWVDESLLDYFVDAISASFAEASGSEP